ncbi:hypothetical protein SALBM311S_10145 [Streptomyces alboniger]
MCTSRRARPPGSSGRPYGQVPACGAVDLLPVGRVLEPEVGAHVDDEHLRAELLGDGGGLPVRQREEDDIVPGENVGRGLLEHTVGERQQVRLERPELLARVGVAGQGTDLDLGVRRSSRRSSPPAYPLAPATAARTAMESILSWMA